MFNKARLKLTAWYLVIIMVISVFFSLVIYQRVDSEYVQFEKIQASIKYERERRDLLPGRPTLIFHDIDPDIIIHARMRLLTTLIIINATILILAGFAGYFLAGRTLRPIQQMLDDQRRFIGDASHELRTPLTSLRSEIEVTLRNKSLKVTEAKKVLESNLEEVLNLQLLSDNLLTLMHQGKLTKKTTEKIVLSEIVSQAVRKLEGLTKKKHISIEINVPDITFMGVTDRICELFVILLDNAIKYSPAKSTVTIAAQKENKMINITVADQGMGIHEDDLPYIFERFYRASKSRSKGSVPGYGLGLSIAEQIVKMHNGDLSIESELGSGTTFTISLPLTREG